MRRKKVLVQGTANSLQKFFSDAAAREFEIIGVVSDDKISVQGLEVLQLRNLPRFVLRLVDGIVFTDTDKSVVNYFLERKISPQKIILWDAAQGWKFFSGTTADGTKVIFLCGLEFHIRNKADEQFFNKTLWRLQNQRQIRNASPKLYPAILAQQFQRRTGKTLDLSNPRTFTDKLQWIKIFDATPTKSRLADKYLVRRWVAEKIGEQYLIPLLGAWDDFDDIDFDALPDQFVLKCNFDREGARIKLKAWPAVDYGTQSGLWLPDSPQKRYSRKKISPSNVAGIFCCRRQFTRIS